MKAQTVLQRNEVVVIDGVEFMKDGDGTVQVGDVYVAERNTGPRILVAKEIHPDGFIVPTESYEYCYDVNECCRVRLV